MTTATELTQMRTLADVSVLSGGLGSPPEGLVVMTGSARGSPELRLLGEVTLRCE
jgi:hypothetical protein